MKNYRAILPILALIAFATAALAQPLNTNQLHMVMVAKNLKYQTGEITLSGGLAKLNVPKGFKFLGSDDTEKVLTELWHNPPSNEHLGMLLPEDKTPLDEDCWAVTISYIDDGFVKDDDASKIDYTDLLKQMQKSAKKENSERIKEGYQPIELVGWAEPPRYDAQTHKLYWAKEIKFGNEPENTLNYNIRILGRRGVLLLNVIATMDQLKQVRERTPEILAIVNFNEGHRYTDFDSKTDKVATYGIAALVAGGVAAKLGFFKLIWVFILAAKKFIIIAIVAIVAFVKRFFNRNKGTTPGT
jgi:uncharacterized membrane-anchored protein